MLSKYFVLFFLYSFLGWIYESIYCTINEQTWQNRGFLYGPCIPIYGFGAVFAQIFLIDLPKINNIHFDYIKLFFICAIGSFFLEYTTSFVLEKVFHARWWDYSGLPLNINGRVCLICTFCFGVAGTLIVPFVMPFIINFVDKIPFIVTNFLSLLLVFILGMDLALTISALSNFAKEFEKINDKINKEISEKVENVKDFKEQLANKYIKQWVEHAPNMQLSQIRHIKKFIHPVSSTKNLLNKCSDFVKQKIRK